jgi:hypothetical protein
MDDRAPPGLFALFVELEDPRVERTRHHRLEDILGLSLIAVVPGRRIPRRFRTSAGRRRTGCGPYCL